jgi:hypothetical protein
MVPSTRGSRAPATTVALRCPPLFERRSASEHVHAVCEHPFARAHAGRTLDPTNSVRLSAPRDAIVTYLREAAIGARGGEALAHERTAVRRGHAMYAVPFDHVV